MSLSATITAGLTVNQTGTPILASQQTLVNNINKTLTTTFSNGNAAANLIDTVYAKSGTFTASTAITVRPVTAGALTDSFGNTVNMLHLKCLYFANLAPATTETNNSVTIGGGTNPITTILPSTSTIVVPAGGSILLTAPGAVGYLLTSGSADTLTFTPGTGTPGYEMILLGASA